MLNIRWIHRTRESNSYNSD